MEYLLIAQSVILAAAVIALAVIHGRSLVRLSDFQSAERAKWADERRELINRAQFPERMPMKTSGASTVHSNLSPETRKALHSVGKVAPQMSTDGD